MRLTHSIGLIGLVPCAAMTLVQSWALIRQPAAVFNSSMPLASLCDYAAAFLAGPRLPVFEPAFRESVTRGLYHAGILLTAALFIGAFWWSTHPKREHRPFLLHAMLAVQLLAALVGQLEMAYFLALAFGVLLPLRTGLAWLAVAAVGCIAVRLPYLVGEGARQFIDPETQLANAAVMAVMQVVCFGFGMLIASEHRRRLVLAAANAELRATQQLLGDMARLTERQRMARDLHDTIGHHLTALNLHLDLASHRQVQPDASIGVARDLARGLMSEVRAVVSAERQHREIDLQAALQTLCQGIPAPRVRMAYDPSITVDSPALAHALFSSIQEALTNCVRHAQATEVEVEVAATGGTHIVATITDNGRGKDSPVRGNGLAGVEERVRALGGAMTESRPAAGGFCLTLTLPKGLAP